MQLTGEFADGMRQRVCALLEEEWEGVDVFREKLPLVVWTSAGSAPDLLTISMIFQSTPNPESADVPVEVVRRWIRTEQDAEMVLARTSSFGFEGQHDDLYRCTEILIEIRRQRDVPSIMARLPELVDDLRFSIDRPEYAASMLDGVGLSVGAKVREIHRLVALLRRRWPKEIRGDIIREVQRLLLITSDEYRAARQARHMVRILTSGYLFRRRLGWKVSRFPDKRHMRVRFFPAKLTYPFGSETVLTLVVGLNIDQEYELFDQRHILRAVRQIVPQARIAHGSYVRAQCVNEQVRLIYVDIERGDGAEFSTKELRELKKQLPGQLRDHIERLSHTIFVHRNEEEVLRSILTLSNELQYVRDIPQVIIQFETQAPTTLTFNVIMARLIGGGGQPIAEILEQGDPEVEFQLEEARTIGYLRKKHAKEASVFSVTIQKEPYLRKDHAVDIYRARSFVGTVLNALVGEVRDFNGGLILKQSEQLEAVRRLLTGDEQQHEVLLENLFYALTPATMQSYLLAERIHTFFLVMLKAMKAPTSKKKRYSLLIEQAAEPLYVWMRADDDTFREEVVSATAHIDMASAFLNIHGASYLGFLCVDEQAHNELRTTIETVLSRWAAQASHRQVVHINLPREKNSFDPRLGGRRSGMLTKMLYEGLMRIGPDGRPILAVAEHVEISNDLKTYTFFLRESYWSNGIPVTAYDFEYAWKKGLDPKVQTRFTYLFNPIKNAFMVKNGLLPVSEVGIRSVNIRKLVVELEHPAPYFLDACAHWIYSPLHREIDRLKPGWAHTAGEAFICNGPFKLASADLIHQIRLIKNPTYWDCDAVKLEEIDISMIEDPVMAYTRFQREELDWVGGPLSDFPEKFKDDPRVEHKPTGAIHWCKINTAHGILKSQKMRQALAYAIDRKKLIESAASGIEEPALSILPKQMTLNGESPLLKDGDIAAARKLFAEALDEAGLTAQEVPAIVLNYALIDREEKVAQAVAEQWREALGIEVRTEGVSWQGYLEHTLAHEYHVALITWHPWSYDPIYNLEHLKYRSDHVNATRWEHPEYRRLLEESDQTIDREVRRTKLQEAERFVMNEMPIIPLYSHAHRFFKHPELKNVLITDPGQIDFKWAYRDYGSLR